jgi:hypothetical protein
MKMIVINNMLGCVTMLAQPFVYFPSLYSSGVMAVRRLKYLEKKAGLGKLRSSEI